MASAFARWLEGLLGPLGLIVFESADPAAKPLVADLFARELQLPGKTPPWPRMPAPRSRRADTSRRLCHSPTACRCSGWRARRPIRRQGDRIPDRGSDALGRHPCSRGSGSSGALQPERPAAAGRAGHIVPHHLLCRRPERAGIPRPAAGVLRALRRADADHVSAREAPRCWILAPLRVSSPRDSVWPIEDSASRRTNPR